MSTKWETIYDKKGILLIRGDCLDILPILEESSVSLVLSDPPYGHNNNDGDLIHQLEKAIPARRSKSDHDKMKDEMRERRKNIRCDARPIINDDAESANNLVKSIINQSKRLLVKGGNLALCCSGGGGPGTIEYANWSIWMDQVLQFKQMIIYNKESLGIGWHYRRNYEVVLIATKPGEKCLWYDETDKIPNVIGPKQGIPKVIPTADQHPNRKPVELAEFFIRLHTKKGDVVLDPCSGEGWVAEACVKMERKFIGIEIDPHWAERMKKRVKVHGVVNKGFGVELR